MSAPVRPSPLVAAASSSSGRLLACLALGGSLLSGPVAEAQATGPRTFESPEAAVRALVETVTADDLPGLVALFGPEGQQLVDSSDPATGRRSREVFLAAVSEGHSIVDAGSGRKELVLGNEAWPFPVPLVRHGANWSFDAAAGREEILDRRIGRNELAVIRVLESYVAAQREYAKTGHDGRRAGLYARRFGSSPGRHDGLYWPSRRGEPRSPLGVLAARASEEGYRKREGEGPSPFHGYYFRILEGQGASAKGGAAEYVKDGEMSGGFALVAWPVHYDASGVMSFLVNHDGIAYEKDLGPDTATLVRSIARFDPDPSWRPVQAVDTVRRGPPVSFTPDLTAAPSAPVRVNGGPELFGARCAAGP